MGNRVAAGFAWFWHNVKLNTGFDQATRDPTAHALHPQFAGAHQLGGGPFTTNTGDLRGRGHDIAVEQKPSPIINRLDRFRLVDHRRFVVGAIEIAAILPDLLQAVIVPAHGNGL